MKAKIKRKDDACGATGHNSDWQIVMSVRSDGKLTTNPYDITDLDIIYDANNQLYSFNLETVYNFVSRKFEKEYVLDMYKRFKHWMLDNDIPTDEEPDLCDMFANPCMGRSLPQLFANIKALVRGFIAEGEPNGT